jgi:hypothetical protein
MGSGRTVRIGAATRIAIQKGGTLCVFVRAYVRFRLGKWEHVAAHTRHWPIPATTICVSATLTLCTCAIWHVDAA